MGSTFSTSNNVVVCLDRLVFNPGETVTGAVLLNILEEMGKFKDLEVEAYGEEETYWEYERSRTVSNSDGSSRTETETIRCSGKDTVFKVKRTLHRWDPAAKVQPGRYVFPFSFTLPATAEPTEHHAWRQRSIYDRPNGFGAHMRWVVTAEANRDCKDLKAATELTVLGPTQLSPAWLSQPAPAVKEEVPVKKMCCCCSFGDRGSMTMSLKADKAAYMGGEVIAAEIEISNDTDEHFKDVEVALVCSGWAKSSHERTCQVGYIVKAPLEGLKPRTKREGFTMMSARLPLPADLRHTRQLHLFGFSYKLVLKAVAGKTSTDPVVEFPLHIQPRPPGNSLAAPAGDQAAFIRPTEAPAWWQPTAVAAEMPLDGGKPSACAVGEPAMGFPADPAAALAK
ncbi:hypothetical protein HYH03_000917 [Edaphochlamys debaryana]|uniref:Arrestin C-terminal-like domain-containing protein n=1 Tax=Edaphochlamys debaryana TaxID=47281 RepID=A0A836C6N1_9CHLO|nr:hypothetical protein HYH03_000917 [Edaphochlamys debaryana]|eukprot:KAG2501099.1 hypothetical protein HYH03_000917 [Edaphochlamys debaryana]